MMEFLDWLKNIFSVTEDVLVKRWKITMKEILNKRLEWNLKCDQKDFPSWKE